MPEGLNHSRRRKPLRIDRKTAPGASCVTLIRHMGSGAALFDALCPLTSRAVSVNCPCSDFPAPIEMTFGSLRQRGIAACRRLSGVLRPHHPREQQNRQHRVHNRSREIHVLVSRGASVKSGKVLRRKLVDVRRRRSIRAMGTVAWKLTWQKVAFLGLTQSRFLLPKGTRGLGGPRLRHWSLHCERR